MPLLHVCYAAYTFADPYAEKETKHSAIFDSCCVFGVTRSLSHIYTIKHKELCPCTLQADDHTGLQIAFNFPYVLIQLKLMSRVKKKKEKRWDREAILVFIIQYV